MPPRLMLALPLSIATLLFANATGSTEPRAKPAPRFDDGAAAVFRHRCVKCHGPRDQGADLRLDTYGGVMRGGEQGPVVVGGDLDASLLYQKITRHHRPPMPPRVPLPSDERETIRAWIEAGALP